MSEGRTPRHTLAPIQAMSDTQMRTEVERWANDLPIGLIGCIVRRNTDWVCATGSSMNIWQWTTTEYTSDHFFQYNSTPEASTMTIPKNLGGLYAYQWNVENNTGAAIEFEWIVRHTDGRSGTITALCRQTEQMAGSRHYTWAGVIPKILSPGDTLSFRGRHDSGSDKTFAPQTPSSNEPHSMILTFYRLFPADAPTQ